MVTRTICAELHELYAHAAGPNLFLGSKRAYALMPHKPASLLAAPPTSTGGAPPSSSTTTPPSAWSGTLGAPTDICLTGTALGPAIALCPTTGEVALARDGAALFFSTEGRPSRRAALAFSEPLCGLAATEQYMLGATASALEVCDMPARVCFLVRGSLFPCSHRWQSCNIASGA